MMNTNDYIFAKTQRMYNTQSDPNVIYRLQLIIMYPYQHTSCNKCPTLIQDVNNRETVLSRRGGICELSVLSA